MGIKFDDITDESLGLNLISVNFGSPEPALIKTEIPGRNGVLDQSEAVAGYTVYKEREVELLFTLKADTEEEYASKIGAVRNALHGKKRKAILSSDPDFYYAIRCLVEEAPESSTFSEITITGTAYPYKRKTTDTVVEQAVTDTATEIICENLAEPVVPTIETSASMQIQFGSKTFNVQAGSHTLDILFTAGENVLTVTGTGDITITYREGSL